MLLLLVQASKAREGSLWDGEERPDSSSNMKVILKKLNYLTDIYGSLRFKVGVSFTGESGLQDNASRMGIRGAIPVTRGIEAIMQLEVGVGLVGNKTTIQFHGDPGGAVGEVDNVFTSRLGYAGIRTKYGQFTWGKQWSVYSDIGGWTDNFCAFGGEASGMYAAGTDGSMSGTGRASNAFQYRLSLDFMDVGIQTQNRQMTDSNATFADTYGASLIFKTGFGLKIGAAYNKVQDGIMNPEAGDPKYDDEAMIAGLSYDRGQVVANFTASKFHNHEKDDLGNFFSGYGLELFCKYSFLERWNVYGGFNYLQPDDKTEAGDYRIANVLIGAYYRYGKTGKLFVETRLDDRTRHDGSRAHYSGVAFGLFFEFGY
jgi:predicted porin